MENSNQDIYGIYQLEKIDSFVDGIKTAEAAKAGMFKVANL